MSDRLPVLHYVVPGMDIEVIDLIRAKSRVATDCWQFFLFASALQYLWRFDLKGAAKEDTEKLVVYSTWLRDSVAGKP